MKCKYCSHPDPLHMCLGNSLQAQESQRAALTRDAEGANSESSRPSEKGTVPKANTSALSYKEQLDLILSLYQRDIERHYGGRTVGKTLNRAEALDKICELNRAVRPENMEFDDPELAKHNRDFTDGFNAGLTDYGARLG